MALKQGFEHPIKENRFRLLTYAVSYPRGNMVDFTWKPHGLVGFSRPNAQLLPNVTDWGWSIARWHRRGESGDF